MNDTGNFGEFLARRKKGKQYSPEKIEAARRVAERMIKHKNRDSSNKKNIYGYSIKRVNGENIIFISYVDPASTISYRLKILNSDTLKLDKYKIRSKSNVSPSGDLEDLKKIKTLILKRI